MIVPDDVSARGGDDPTSRTADAGHADLARQAVSGTMWSLVRFWGSRGVSTVVFLVLARLLAPEDFGLVALAAVFTGFLDLLVEQGFGDALVQRKDLDHRHLHTAFWLSVAVGLVMGAVALLGAGPVATLLDEPDLAPIVRVLALGFLLSSMATVPSALLRRRMQFKSIALRMLVANTAAGGAAIGVAAAGGGAWALVTRSLTQTAVGLVVTAVAARYWPRLSFSVRHVRELVRFSGPVVGINIVQFGSRHADDLLIGAVLGTTALGYYTVGYQLLFIVIALVGQTIDAVALPTFSRLHADPLALRRGLLATVRISSLVGFPVFVALGVLAPELVAVAFGSEWEPSAPVLAVLAIAGLVQPTVSFLATTMKAAGRPGLKLRTAVLQGGTNIALFALVVRFGIEAVAIAFVVRTYALFPVEVLAARQVVDVSLRELWRAVSGPVKAAAAMAAAAFAARSLLHEEASDPVVLVAAGAAGVFTYALLVWLLDRPVVRELLRYVGRRQGPRDAPAGAAHRA